MQSVNFKGAVHDLLLEFFMVKDGFSIGEKFTHLEKQLPKKKFYYSSDEEIYNTLETIIKSDYYSDEG